MIDTNILIDFLAGHQSAARFLHDTPPGTRISTITAIELLAGTRSRERRRQQAILELINEYEPAAVTVPIAVIAGSIVREHQLSVADAIIAATAIDQQATIVTNDRKAHMRVPGLRVLIPY